MLPQERKQWIRRELKRTGGIRTTVVARTLGISLMTIWRDLEEMEKEGELRRVHGGALPPPPADTPEPEFSSKAAWRSEKCEMISRYAAQRFPKRGMSIAMEGGTTVVGVLDQPNLRDLSILTNSVEILRSAPAGCVVHASGGEYRPVSRTFVGPQAVAFFKSHRSDLCLISATGYDNTTGLTDPNPLEIEVKRAMCQNSSRVVLLLDAEKFGIRSLSFLMDLSNLHLLVTNESAPKSALAKFRAKGVAIELV